MRSLRPVAARSAALLHALRDPATVLAWLCPRCGQWVTPADFSAASGLCRPCTSCMSELGGARRG